MICFCFGVVLGLGILLLVCFLWLIDLVVVINVDLKLVIF